MRHPPGPGSARFARYGRKVGIAATLLFASSVASAQSNDEAVTRFERGVQLYEAQNFEGALLEFNAAYKLTGNYRLLYNIGICQQQTREYVAAADTYRKYLRDGGAEISAERKADVEDRLSKLALSVSRVRIVTDAPQGTIITVDDRPVGTIPLGEPVSVKIGKRVFAFTANGKTVTKTVEIISGDNYPVNLLLADAAPSAPAVTTSPAKHEKPIRADDDGPSFPWPLWTITALLGGGAAVTGILAVKERNDFEEKQATFGVTRSELEDKRSDAQTLGIVTDVLLACTIVSAGLSTYFTIRWASSGPSKSSTSNGLYLTPGSVGWVRSF
jgi:hypothetical protein